MRVCLDFGGAMRIDPSFTSAFLDFLWLHFRLTFIRDLGH